MWKDNLWKESREILLHKAVLITVENIHPPVDKKSLIP